MLPELQGRSSRPESPETIRAELAGTDFGSPDRCTEQRAEMELRGTEAGSLADETAGLGYEPWPMGPP